MASDAFMELSSLKIEGESGDKVWGKGTAYGMFEISSFEFNVGETSSKKNIVGKADAKGNVTIKGQQQTPEKADKKSSDDKGSFTIKKPIDYASPALFRRCCHKIAISWAVITFREAGEVTREYPWLMIEFRELHMKSFNWDVDPAATGEEAMKMETIVFEFETMLVYYQQQLSDGTHTAPQTGSWNFAKHITHVEPIAKEGESDKYDEKDVDNTAPDPPEDDN